jgi:hypothetical protein
VDKDFLRKMAPLTTEDFDSNGSHKLCMEHFSPDATPTAIKDCDELVRCLRGLLYDELWDVGWKKSLETTFVDFLENFERKRSIRLDWHYASSDPFFLPPPAGDCSAAKSRYQYGGTGHPFDPDRATGEYRGVDALYVEGIHPFL